MSKISQILTSHGLSPDRRYGQCFLVNQGALQSIVDISGVGPDSSVVEIGAGLGNLTELLARKAGTVAAVELDRNFEDVHQSYFAKIQNVIFTYGDFLELPMASLFPEKPLPERLVVGNIPYNITARILMKLLAERESFDRAYILMQREVAERLQAKPGRKRYSVLTAKLSCGLKPKIRLTLSGKSFTPTVKVQSSLVEFTPSDTILAPDPVERAEFFEMLDGAFAHRRKTVANSLAIATTGKWQRDPIAEILVELGHDKAVRAEGLDVSQALDLFRAIREKLGPASVVGKRS